MIINFIVRKTKEIFSRETLSSLLSAIFFMVVVNTFFVQQSQIPSGSMKSALHEGDTLLVYKPFYGVRVLPRTLLALPFMQNTIWGTKIRSYLRFSSISGYWRIGQWSDYKRFDVVVFNFPGDPHPVDCKATWIKRIVGLPGDEIEIKNREIYINGEQLMLPPTTQRRYLLETTRLLPKKFFEKYRIEEFQELQDGRYEVYITDHQLAQLESLPVVVRVIQVVNNKKDRAPFLIPKKGVSIPINEKTLPIIFPIVKDYEWNKEVRVDWVKHHLFIEGKRCKSYTPRQNYYFVKGDNENSYDSISWPFIFLPEDHILARANGGHILFSGKNPKLHPMLNLLFWNLRKGRFFQEIV